MSAIRETTSRNVRWTFAGVTLDLERRSVWVDGRPTGCSGKAFELLLVLCQHAQQPLPRDTLINKVWPGGQIVSDEALTQLVFRARAVLGPYGNVLKTVRGVGFELTVPAQCSQTGVARTDGSTTLDVSPTLPVPDSADIDATQIPQENPVMGGKARSIPSRPALVLIGALLLAMLGWWAWHDVVVERVPAITTTVLNEGYGLQSDDLPGASADTLRLLEQALRREDLGERLRALSLLRAAHADGSAPALPAILLALWNQGSGRTIEARDWLQQAQERLLPSTGPYQRLMYLYVRAELEEDTAQIISTAGALLDLRPSAWRMRQARAHLFEYRGLRAAALNELRFVEIPRLGLRKRDLTIADLASFGDMQSAQAHLERLAEDPERATWYFLQGRLAWTRTDWAAAVNWFDQTVRHAAHEGQVDLRNRAMSYQGAAQVLLGDDLAAIATLERARELLGNRQPRDELDLTILLAGLRAGQGHTTLLEADLARARQLLTDSVADDNREAARLALLRLAPNQAPPAPDLPPGSAEGALWQAAWMLEQREDAAAAEALTLAIQRGIGDTRLWDDARWLQHQLGQKPGPAQPIDPPYPPLSRMLIRRQLPEG
ncbi:MAG: winged helix-turn-helix domain-containing protein [Lysobacterales bacterium]|nr:winged helix-turn-helix domain-containing protein [Xanthomonadales bacterium]MCB1612566.1 winged helix-turn-helix domain-containing protein [Xanthomonadales bacterium]